MGRRDAATCTMAKRNREEAVRNKKRRLPIYLACFAHTVSIAEANASQQRHPNHTPHRVALAEDSRLHVSCTKVAKKGSNSSSYFSAYSATQSCKEMGKECKRQFRILRASIEVEANGGM